MRDDARGNHLIPFGHDSLHEDQSTFNRRVSRRGHDPVARDTLATAIALNRW
jgi:hypothetical protein